MKNIISHIKKLFAFESQIKQLRYELKADQLTRDAQSSHELGICNDSYLVDKRIIVSLTSFGERIKDAYLSIESIMQGTMKPNKIVLWLGKEYESNPLPIILQKQIRRGLEVRFTKDIRSYTKLIPSLREYPEDIIITIDDDIIYNHDLVENLFLSYLDNPQCIHSNRVHVVSLTTEGKFSNYSSWNSRGKANNISYFNFLTGVGGVLYPPHCFVEEVLNESVFLDICRYADDVWFYAMAIMSHTKIKKAQTRNSNGIEYLYSIEEQEFALNRINTAKGRSKNDEQLEVVCSKYNIYQILQKEKL